MDKLTEEFKVAKSAITPATADLLYEREDSELMRDQMKFMSYVCVEENLSGDFFPGGLPSV